MKFKLRQRRWTLDENSFMTMTGSYVDFGLRTFHEQSSSISRADICVAQTVWYRNEEELKLHYAGSEIEYLICCEI